MYDELVKRVRQVAEKVGDDYDVDPYIAEQRSFVIEEAANALERMPKWIPVTERLPEDLTRVIVFCEGGVSYGLCEHLIADDEEVVEWHDFLHYPITPTHWMPLPEPPKEG